MRIVTNKRLVDRNKKISTYLFFGTFAVLIAGFVFINQSIFTGEAPPLWIVLAQALVLPVAFGLTLASVRMTNLWARQPRPEAAIPEGLKGLSTKSTLYNYLHFPARHVLICPQGIFAIVTRWHDSSFSVENDQWTSHQKIWSRIASAIRFDGIGNPHRDAEKAVAKVKEFLTPIAPDVDVKPLIVFVEPDVQLNIKSTSIPVLYADPKREPSLKSYLRDLNREQSGDDASDKRRNELPLTDEQLEAFDKATMS